MNKDDIGALKLVRPVCFSIRSIAGDFPLDPIPVVSDINESWRLSDQSIEAFSRLLPLLACGEESAIHVFSNAAKENLPPQGGEDVKAELSALTLMNIAKDEMQHEAWLAAWRSRLPDCLDHTTRRQARKFFAGLDSRTPATHFARIAALDSAVCQILASLLGVKAALTQVAEIKSTFDKIRRDEARHVRISRNYACAWGATPEQIRAEWLEVRGALVTLLETVAPELAILGAHPEHLFKKLKQQPTLPAQEFFLPLLPATAFLQSVGR